MPSLQRERAFEQRGADELVERVVTADVLARAAQRAARVEQRRRVQAAGGFEDALLRARSVSGRPVTMAGATASSEVTVGNAAFAQRFERRAAANAAGTGRREVAFQGRELRQAARAQGRR